MSQRRAATRDPDSRERGSVTLELAVLFPVFLLLLLLIAQAALYFTARSIALSAAQKGADTAHLLGRRPGDGASAATAFATSQGDGLLTGLAVSTNGSTATQVAVAVSGHALTLVPGLDLTVRQTATAAREHYTTATAPGAGP